MKKNVITKSILLVLLLCVLISMPVFAKEETIPQGVFIENVDVSGMTVQQANDAVSVYVKDLDEKEITLRVMDDNEITISAQELGLVWSNKDIIDEAVTLGKKGNPIKRYKVLRDLKHQNKVYKVELAVDENILEEIINEKCTKFNQEAVDASLSRKNGTFTVVDGQEGVVVSVKESMAAVQDFMKQSWDHEDATIDLVVEVDEPKGQKEDLLKVKDVLGSFTTSYKTSGSSRTGNVSNGTNLIDGTTLYPGEEFSMYEAVSPFTEANGYYMAGSYLNGLVVDSLGGGICQVSTTLYNAVLLSELDVTERFNHSMIVGYVDPSADAAIAGTAKDLKFVNNKEYPIYIEGITTSDKRITFNIYGVEDRPSNRKVSYESEVIEVINPEGEKIIQDGGQPVGFVNVQSAHTGYVAKLWKVVKEDGVEVSRTQVNSSKYKATPRTATVGVATPDPNLSSAMQAAIATGSIDYVKNLIAAYNAQVAAGAGTMEPQPDPNAGIVPQNPSANNVPQDPNAGGQTESDPNAQGQ